MVTLAIVLASISLVLVLFVGMIALITANNLMNLEKRQGDKQPDIQQPNSPAGMEQESAEFHEGYKRAVDVLLNTITLSLFDMHQKMEILDFEEQVDALMKRMDVISNDKEYCDEVISKYTEYMEEMNGNSSNDY